MAKKLVFLGMGGTIAGTSSVPGDNVGYKAAQVQIHDLLTSVPGMQVRLAGCSVQAEQVCQIDSKDVRYADWAALWDRVKHHLAMDDVQGIVVTHGTDTLEETAFFLSRVLPAASLHKPVVFTCAMRPASASAGDGPGNLADAVSVARCAGACGVLVVAAGQVYGAADVQKVHPYRVNAFDSGESGPLAVVEEGRVRMLCAWPQPDPAVQDFDKLLNQSNWPRVDLLISHAGSDGAMVRALLTRESSTLPLRGIVVAGTGNGSVHHDLEAALLEAQRQGVQVVITTRCAYGKLVGPKTNPFPAAMLSPVKARIALMLDIAAQT